MDQTLCDSYSITHFLLALQKKGMIIVCDSSWIQTLHSGQADVWHSKLENQRLKCLNKKNQTQVWFQNFDLITTAS